MNKPCSSCGEDYPATAEFFDRCKANKDGLSGRCKVCKSESARIYRTTYPERVRAQIKTWRQNNQEHIREYAKAYNKVHLEHNRDVARAWRRKHVEYVRARDRAYYSAHKEHKARLSRARYARNADHFRQMNRAWKKRNPDVVRAQIHRRRARKLAGGGQFTAEQLRNLLTLQKGRCWWCGKKLKDKRHIDHRIPVAKGGSSDISNIVLTCPKCNLSKGAKLPMEFAGRLL